MRSEDLRALAQRVADALAAELAEEVVLLDGATGVLQRNAVRLAPRGPNADRARAWLAEGADILLSGGS